MKAYKKKKYQVCVYNIECTILQLITSKIIQLSMTKSNDEDKQKAVCSLTLKNGLTPAYLDDNK